MAKKTTTVSLANTPVQRGLARVKRSSLIILFALGITAGFVYKAFFNEQPATAGDVTAVEAAPPAASVE